MTYRYAHRGDNSDLASGRVLRSAPGAPGFPVRLASEIFQRATALHGSSGSPVTVWDPCCGSGYLLTVLGLLHPQQLRTIVATDYDEYVLSLARANLALLTTEGLEQRCHTLAGLAEAHGKSAHHEAVQSADRLLHQVRESTPPTVVTRQADAFRPHQLATVLDDAQPDLVLTDVPYGQLTHWSAEARAHAQPVAALVRSLAGVVRESTILALTCRARRIPLDGLRPVSSFKIGHRSVAFFRAANLTR